MRRCHKLISMIVMMAMLATMTPYQALAAELPSDAAAQENQTVAEEEGQEQKQDTQETIPEDKKESDSTEAVAEDADPENSDAGKSAQSTQETAAPEEPGTETPADPVQEEKKAELKEGSIEAEAGSMPAFSARNTAGNGVTVSVSAEEGVFPDGTTMVVTAASKEVVIEAAQAITLRKVVDAAAVNISFYNEQGKEIEPADHSKVHVTLRATDGSVDGRDFLVVHVNDNMAAEQVTDIVGLTGGEATFYANEFSIYAIIGTDPSDDGEALERITYKIYDKEDGNLLSTQIVKTGDTLAEPQLPDPEKGQTFLGWYIKSDGAYERFNGFGVVIRVEDTNSDTVVNVFPRYGELYTVCFHDVTQDDVIVDTISGERTWRFSQPGRLICIL